MILWTFLFTDRRLFQGRVDADGNPVAYQSARVAAPTRDIAYMMMGQKLGMPIAGELSVVCAPAGMILDGTIKVVSMKTVEGRVEAC